MYSRVALTVSSKHNLDPNTILSQDCIFVRRFQADNVDGTIAISKQLSTALKVVYKLELFYNEQNENCLGYLWSSTWKYLETKVTPGKIIIHLRACQAPVHSYIDILPSGLCKNISLNV